MYFHISVAQEIHQQQVAQWEREAAIRRLLQPGKRGRARNGSPANVDAAGRLGRPAAHDSRAPRPLSQPQC